MTRPKEATGLTSGLANRAHQLAADLAALLADEIYRGELCHAAGSPDLAKNANVHLRTAACTLAALADALRAAGEPPPARCGHCGATVTDPATHKCEAPA